MLSPLLKDHGGEQPSIDSGIGTSVPGTPNSSSAVQIWSPTPSSVGAVNHVDELCEHLQETLGTPTFKPAPSSLLDEVQLQAVFKRLDRAGVGSVTKLRFLQALQHETELAEAVLPGVDCSTIFTENASFDAAEAFFAAASGHKQRLTIADLAWKLVEAQKPVPRDAKGGLDIAEVFALADINGVGTIVKPELFGTVLKSTKAALLVLPGLCDLYGSVKATDQIRHAVDNVFAAMSQGHFRVSLGDFKGYFARVHTAKMKPLIGPKERAGKRVFVVGAGFHPQLTPQFSSMMQKAGFQVHWHGVLPHPNQPGFNLGPHLGPLSRAIADAKPDVVICASLGSVYVSGLWQNWTWRGPTVMLGIHPALTRLPPDVQMVLAAGSNDEVFRRQRADCERLVQTGTPDKCYLFYTANSGALPTGGFSRVGDGHCLESVLTYDCLPRLLDAAMHPDGPEACMIRSWRARLHPDRLEAEEYLGHTLERFGRLWTLPPGPEPRGCEPPTLFEVRPGTDEFMSVIKVFKAPPKEPPAYLLGAEVEWCRRKVVKIQRVENRRQAWGSFRPYSESMRRCFEKQGLQVEPGVHSYWVFHGSQDLDRIVTDPVVGFQPLSCTRTLWGLGTYFARDARYVAEGLFCPQEPDGTRRMLMVLLNAGIPCLGGPQQNGVLPYRKWPHRYNSSVDSLSSPELHIVPHIGAAYPGYVITFL